MIRRVIMKFTFGEFKSNKQGAYILIAAEDIVGFCKRAVVFTEIVIAW